LAIHPVVGLTERSSRTDTGSSRKAWRRQQEPRVAGTADH